MENFRIDVPQADLDDLRARLAQTRWPATLPGAERGVPVADLRALVDHWLDGFDWRAVEARLNAFPQFRTSDGIHFVHARSENPDAIPLIITHSWPNSVFEYVEVIEQLTRDFHVVAPSLPGFGFSALGDEPWTIKRVAVRWAELMEELGYERYGAHGNDAGAMVTPELAAHAPDRVIGSHITGGLGMEEMLANVDWASAGSGYGAYLGRRPQTLSYGFTDSPVMQLAYLVERYREFDRGADALTPDQVLTNASLYWLTGTGGTSSWTYYEGQAGMPISQDVVPTGVSHGGPFREQAEKNNDIVHWGDRESPSHMVAMAAPDSLVEDIREFFTLVK
ncbi:epoxide hydrolase [Lentzea tibetensis]|uniref:Epoxide hydrolase n=1 Tax=Lentzea tibetensis TaxID=2591470 RepID=A0A563EF48_9PSEU|nr:epoxide hydrolase family protein [Lentzea tibetensis]TWP44047.1 epoxide hydrolase [Lentzea tibetensis]